MDIIHDSVFRDAGNPFWDRQVQAELPSRRRLLILRSELAAQRRLAAAARPPWPRRALLLMGDRLVAAGERLRAGRAGDASPRAVA